MFKNWLQFNWPILWIPRTLEGYWAAVPGCQSIHKLWRLVFALFSTPKVAGLISRLMTHCYRAGETKHSNNACMSTKAKQAWYHHRRVEQRGDIFWGKPVLTVNIVCLILNLKSLWIFNNGYLDTKIERLKRWRITVYINSSFSYFVWFVYQTFATFNKVTLSFVNATLCILQ